MRRKAVSETMRAFRLIFFLVWITLFAFPSAVAYEWVHYIPTPSQVTLGYRKEGGISYTDVSIWVPNTGFNFSDFGTPVVAGNSITADAQIWKWTGGSGGMILIAYHTYNLGHLLSGEYVFAFKVWSQSVKSITFTVLITVPDDYATIQEAINNVPEGDTIFVKSGTYFEHPVVNKTVSLVGENESTTIIDGNNVEGGVFNVTAGSVSIQHFSIVNGYTGVDVYQDNVTVSYNLITINGSGIVLRGSNNVVQSNIIKCNSGIHLDHFSGNNTVMENQIQYRNPPYPEGKGIWLQQSNNNNTFAQNEIRGFAAGVWWEGDSYGNLFGENAITDNLWGFFIGNWALQNIIRSNSISMNSLDGIRLSWMCGQNTITDNIISNNGQSGIYVESCGELTIARNKIIDNEVGIKLVGPTGPWKGNSIYHNNFFNNTQQVYINQTLLSKWDNGCEGNFWSDYNGTDLDNDGVGDTLLPWQGVDYYPLVNPCWNLADINHDLKVDGRDVARVASAFGSFYPEHPRWNPHADVNEDGKIDGKDIALVAKDFGETYP